MKGVNKKIKYFIYFILLLVSSIMIFSEPPKAPNQLVTENPKREVTTVEANKNREHAEMSITVNKINQKSMDAFLWPTGELLLYLPKETKLQNKMINNNIYYIADSLNNFPDISTVNGKKYFKNFNKFTNKSIDSSMGIRIDKTQDFALINTYTEKKLYLGLLDQKTGSVENVWDIKVIKAREENMDIEGTINKVEKTITFDANLILEKHKVTLDESSVLYIVETLGPGTTKTSVTNSMKTKKNYTFKNNKMIYKYNGEVPKGIEIYTFDQNKRILKKLSYGAPRLHLDKYYKEEEDMTGKELSMNFLKDGYQLSEKASIEFYCATTYSESAGPPWEHLSTIRPPFAKNQVWDEMILPPEYGGSFQMTTTATNIEARLKKNTDKAISKRYVKVKFYGGTTGDYYHNVLGYSSKARTETTITLSNPIFAGTYGKPFGRLRTWLEGSSVKIGRLDKSGNNIPIDPVYGATIGSNSKTTPVTTEEVGTGTKLDVVINDQVVNKTISWNDITHPDGLIGSVYYRVGGLDIGADYQNGAKSKYGTDFSLQSWNLEAQDVNIEMRHELVTNAFKIKIPRFDGLVYYDYSVGNIEKNTKTYSASLSNVPLINEIARIYLQTKNYDLRILGSRGGTNSNLEIRIPKVLTLKAKGKNSKGENIVPYDIDFNVEILTHGENTSVDNSNLTHYILYSKKMEDFTRMTAAIVLKGKSRSNVAIPKELYGENLKFVTIGVKDKPNFNETIIDRIELKGNVNILKQTVDFRKSLNGDKINGDTPFSSLDDHRVELWDETTSLFPSGTTILTLQGGVEIPEAGVSVKYDLNTDNLIFTKTGDKNYSNSNLKLNFLHSGGMLLRSISLTVLNFKKLEGETTLNLSNPIVQGDPAEGSLGRIRLWSNTPSNLTILGTTVAGLLNNTNTVALPATPDKKAQFEKNGEFAISAGSTIVPIATKEQTGSDQVEITIGSSTKTEPVNWGDINTENGIMSTVYGNIGASEIGIDFQGPNSNNGIDIALTKWDLNAISTTLEVNFPLIKNKINLNIPRFDPLPYYDYNAVPPGGTVDPNVPITPISPLNKHFEAIVDEKMSGTLLKIPIMTKNYDLRILGKIINLPSKLALKVPRESKFKVTSMAENGTLVTTEHNVGVSVVDFTGEYKLNSDGYINLFPPNQGVEGDNSALSGYIKLELEGNLRSAEIKKIIKLESQNTPFLQIGIGNNGEFDKTIIDKVTITTQFTNLNQEVDFTNHDLTSKERPDNTIESDSFLVEYDNNFILYENGTKIYSGDMDKLINDGIVIPKSGVSIKFDSGNSKLLFKKVGYKDYDNNKLKLTFMTKSGHLIRDVNLDVKNDSGFEILDGQDSLNFGHFFPGNIKNASRLIEFKNLYNLEVLVDLDRPNNDENIYLGGTKNNDPTKTIPLTNTIVKDVKTVGNRISSFKIGATATTNQSTKAGKYKGSLNVIVIIDPSRRK